MKPLDKELRNLIAMRQFRNTSPLPLMKLREPTTLWIAFTRMLFVDAPSHLLIDHRLNLPPCPSTVTTIPPSQFSNPQIFIACFILFVLSLSVVITQRDCLSWYSRTLVCYLRFAMCVFTIVDRIYGITLRIWMAAWLLRCFASQNPRLGTTVPSWMWVGEGLLIRFWHPSLLLQGHSR